MDHGTRKEEFNIEVYPGNTKYKHRSVQLFGEISGISLASQNLIMQYFTISK